MMFSTEVTAAGIVLASVGTIAARAAMNLSIITTVGLVIVASIPSMRVSRTRTVADMAPSLRDVELRIDGLERRDRSLQGVVVGDRDSRARVSVQQRLDLVASGAS